jgi:hypothetical protein
VTSLVAFPQVLATMGQKPEWVQDLGDAFLAQPTETMDAVQRLRKAAQNAGQLKSNEQQKVVIAELDAAAERDRHPAGAAAGGVCTDVQPDGGLRRLALPGLPALLHPAAAGLLLRQCAAHRHDLRRRTGHHQFALGRLQLGSQRRQHQHQPLQQRQRQPKDQHVNQNNFTHNSGRSQGRALSRHEGRTDRYGKQVAGKDARNDYRGHDANDAKRDTARRNHGPAHQRSADTRERLAAGSPQTAKATRVRRLARPPARIGQVVPQRQIARRLPGTAAPGDREIASRMSATARLPPSGQRPPRATTP